MKGMDITEVLHKEAKTAEAVMVHKTGNLTGEGLAGRRFLVVTELATIGKARNLKVQPIDKVSSFLQ